MPALVPRVLRQARGDRPAHEPPVARAPEHVDAQRHVTKRQRDAGYRTGQLVRLAWDVVALRPAALRNPNLPPLDAGLGGPGELVVVAAPLTLQWEVAGERRDPPLGAPPRFARAARAPCAAPPRPARRRESGRVATSSRARRPPRPRRGRRAGSRRGSLVLHAAAKPLRPSAAALFVQPTLPARRGRLRRLARALDPDGATQLLEDALRRELAVPEL